MKILIIEDDAGIIDFLTTALGVGWPEADLISASKGRDGIKLAGSASPDIILLDLGLPDMSGFEVLKTIRSFSLVPIIIITVSGEEGDVVKGITLGANEYITKPLRPMEMIARMKALIRSDSLYDDLTIQCGPIHFGTSICEVYKGRQMIRLTPTEGRILHTLMKNASKTISYANLARVIWGEYYPGIEDTMKSHIFHLRQKLEDDPKSPVYILNTAGVGYLFVLKN